MTYDEALETLRDIAQEHATYLDNRGYRDMSVSRLNKELARINNAIEVYETEQARLALETPWENDFIQFARLLNEIRATQEDFDEEALCDEMDLEPSDIDELFDRAMIVWETAKGNL